MNPSTDVPINLHTDNNVAATEQNLMNMQEEEASYYEYDDEEGKSNSVLETP